MISVDWQERAACRGRSSVDFFLEVGLAPKWVFDLCRGCPVRDDCLDYALDNDIRHGIWAGLSARARRGMRARERA